MTKTDRSNLFWGYNIGGITFQVKSDLPVTARTFRRKFQPFRADAPGDDLVILHHHFGLPDLPPAGLGEEVYRRPPWAIYRRADGWLYLGIAVEPDDPTLHRAAYFNPDHTRAEIYGLYEQAFRRGGLDSLTLFPTDQILLARLLADRQGCILHAAGIELAGQGLVFAGHSGAGKSTITRMLAAVGQILCDDRVILRHGGGGFDLYGTWSHGDVPHVSPGPAPLRAILLLEQSVENRLEPLDDRRQAAHRLLPLLIKPLVTAEWWEKTLAVVEQIVCEVPVYRLKFDRSGQVVDLLTRLVTSDAPRP